jgi:hypothetical protein
LVKEVLEMVENCRIWWQLGYRVEFMKHYCHKTSGTKLIL